MNDFLDQPQGPVSVRELDDLCRQIKEKREFCANMKAELAIHHTDLAQLEGKAAGYLEELKRDSYKSPHGTLTKVEKWRFNLPKSDEDKIAFRQWLRNRGIEDKYLTVPSEAYNSLCNEERVIALKQGEILSIPGVPIPSCFISTRFTKK
jgi:hypothetical protein